MVKCMPASYIRCLSELTFEEKNMNPNSAPPSPALFMDTISGYQRTACLRTAIDLGLFTAIGEGHQTASAIAKQCAAAERGVRILCDYLTTLGFLTKQADAYGLTPDTAMFLDKKSPAYLGGTVEFLLSQMSEEAFRNLTEAVKKGGTVILENGATTPEHPMWVRFARAMAALMMMPSQLVAQAVTSGEPRKMKVLDIAAGHGLFGIQVAKQNPMAEIYALDWPNVLQVATENAGKWGVAERHHLLPGSAFDVDFGSGFDVVLLTNFLHHFDPQTNEKLLRKIHGSLNPDGRVYTFDFVPNEDRVSPEVPARFSMMMLAMTPSGDAYTFAELEKMFHNAGFKRSEIRPLPPTFSSLITSQK